MNSFLISSSDKLVKRDMGRDRLELQATILVGTRLHPAIFSHVSCGSALLSFPENVISSTVLGVANSDARD